LCGVAYEVMAQMWSDPEQSLDDWLESPVSDEERARLQAADQYARRVISGAS
jgi:hypothetical protein